MTGHVPMALTNGSRLGQHDIVARLGANGRGLETMSQPETGHERDIDVLGQPGLAPSLDGQPTNYAAAPTPSLTDLLDAQSRGEQPVHRAS